MAAGQGFKTFATGDILTASDTNGYLMSQTVMVFADSSARSTAITSPQQGMISFLKGTNSTEYYNGTAWVAVSGGSSGSMTSIATGTFAASALSLTSISGSYKDLVLVLRGVTVVNDDIGIRLNTDSASNYAWVQSASNMTANGVSTSNTRIQTTQPYITTGSTPNEMYLTIYDYTNTTSWKSVNSVNTGNAASAKNVTFTTALWASTAAVTGISSVNTFATGTYILYGVN